MRIERVPMGRGLNWIAEGYAFLRAVPLIWMVDSGLFLIVLGLLSLVPLFGSIASTLLQPVLVAGLLQGCRDQERGGTLRLEHLVLGFRQNTRSLMMLGLVLGFAALAVVVVLGGIILSTGLLGSAWLEFDAPITEFPGPSELAAWFAVLLVLSVGALLSLPLAMAAWFAPALVMFGRLGPWDALRASFVGCLRNPLPFLLYGLGLLVLLIVAMIPFGLGLLLWLPILFGSVYVSYRDIYPSDS